jgi:hypothetical protein
MNAILFQPTGEVRYPKETEYFMDSEGLIRMACFGFEIEEYPIYTRHEIPEEVAQRMMEEAERG